MSSILTKPESFRQLASDREAASGTIRGENDLPFKLPTRIITCAWGEKYIGELLSITLPALLAPGNLPYVASVVPCELVILTEQALFSRVSGDLTVRKIRELCSVRLVEIDDLIPSRDQYGMAITYALHRGFSDLGQSATDTWLLFLNSDFILADGSLRSVVRHLARGERLIASPSYCVKAENATPDLLKRVDPRSRALSIPPRAMAALVLQYRHDSIRGKTVNQTVISIRYMDQFYWLVDSNTMLGHQMPVSIVGMRPERNLPEPNSFWDYGLISEFCPNTEHFVLGDSDEFLMMELRRQHVTEDWIVTGWPQPHEIARNMISFATPYTKDMARHQLTLHSAELPDGIEEARAKLRAFVDSVFVHLPAVLPSHLGHPQFDYHWSSFMETRHKYLSTRLGSVTETEEPPASLTELDRAWWKLDGLTKSYTRRRDELIDLMKRQHCVIGRLLARLDETVQTRRDSADERLLRDMDAMQPRDHKTPLELNRTVQLQPSDAPRSGLGPNGNSGWFKAILQDLEEEWTRFTNEVREKREFFTHALNVVDKHCKERLLMLEVDFETVREQLQFDYERLLRKQTQSATIPHIVTTQGPRTLATGSSDKTLLTMARRIYHKSYGKMPRVQPPHPYWAAMRHLIRLVDTAAEKGAANVLVVIGSGGVADTVAEDLPGLHVQVSLSELIEGNFRKAFLQPVKFDLCICSLGHSELARFREMAQAVAPYMNNGGKILGFYPNFDLRPISREEIVLFQNALDLPWPGRLYYAGSDKSARVVRRFHAAQSGGGGQLARLARMATMLLIISPNALAANRSEAAAPEEQSARLPEHCTSVTIEVTT